MQTETDSFTDSMEDKKFDIQTQTNRPTNQIKDSRAREGGGEIDKKISWKKRKGKEKERKKRVIRISFFFKIERDIGTA